jgi:hypothetical protein
MLDADALIELVKEIQRDMAPMNYITPWIARVGVYSWMPQVQDYYYKSSFRRGTETTARMWLDETKRL